MKKTTISVIGFFALILAACSWNGNSAKGNDEQGRQKMEQSSAVQANGDILSDEGDETMENKSEQGTAENLSGADAELSTKGIEIPAPLKDRSEQIIQHNGYTLSYNKSHNTANWSAWELTAKEAEGELPRKNKFWADPNIETAYRVDWYEYKGSGYDRGHLCPAADMKWSEDAMHDCFYMSNICPQEPRLNGGAWKKLEEECRNWALREKAIYIVCGPVYKKGKHEQIGIDHAIDVPEGFFKVVLSIKKGNEKAIGFYYENTPRKQPMIKAATSVDCIEELTGIDFFPSLPDSLEKALESRFSFAEWK